MWLHYYDRVIDCCIENGLEPYVTLFHWELQQCAEDKGGWENPEIPRRFAEYAGMIARRYKGRVRNYITFNEIECVMNLGYKYVIHAPGKTCGNDRLVLIWKGMVTAHGLAMRRIKETDPDVSVGIVTCGNLCYTKTGSAEDLEASRLATFRMTEENWTFTHPAVLDAVCFGKIDIPAELKSEEWEIIH